MLPTASDGARPAGSAGRPGKRRSAGVVAPPPDVSAPLILIGAGGTAGHVVPALAVADALQAEGARVAFVGR